MNTILSIAIVLFCAKLFLTKTWTGRTVMNIFKGLTGICKSIFYCTAWMYKKINKFNGKMKKKINGKNKKIKNENNGKNKSNGTDGKVINIKDFRR